jgi:hypothetical protein
MSLKEARLTCANQAQCTCLRRNLLDIRMVRRNTADQRSRKEIKEAIAI